MTMSVMTRPQKIHHFLHDFHQFGQVLTESDVLQWLQTDINDLGYKHLDDAGWHCTTYSWPTKQSNRRSTVSDEDEEPEDPHCVSHANASCGYAVSNKQHHITQVFFSR